VGKEIMKYRTVIEIVTEAKDKHEAIDIAGEFLNGGGENGVSMKCRTTLFRPYILAGIGIFFTLACTVLGTVSLRYFKSGPGAFSGARNISAIQPPLRTSEEDAFMNRWQKEKAKKVLEYVKSE